LIDVDGRLRPTPQNPVLAEIIPEAENWRTATIEGGPAGRGFCVDEAAARRWLLLGSNSIQ